MKRLLYVADAVAEAFPMMVGMGCFLGLLLAVSVVTGGPVGEGLAVCIIGWFMIYAIAASATYLIRRNADVRRGVRR